jgi:hypothetical protein
VRGVLVVVGVSDGGLRDGVRMMGDGGGDGNALPAAFKRS